MPITKSAIKKLYQDKKRTAVNRIVKVGYKGVVKKFRKQPKKEQLAQVFEALDRAAKKRVIHPNKAARLKSRLSRLITGSTSVKQPKVLTAKSAKKGKTAAKTSKKASKKKSL